MAIISVSSISNFIKKVEAYKSISEKSYQSLLNKFNSDPVRYYSQIGENLYKLNYAISCYNDLLEIIDESKKKNFVDLDVRIQIFVDNLCRRIFTHEIYGRSSNQIENMRISCEIEESRKILGILVKNFKGSMNIIFTNNSLFI